MGEGDGRLQTLIDSKDQAMVRDHDRSMSTAATTDCLLRRSTVLEMLPFQDAFVTVARTYVRTLV